VAQHHRAAYHVDRNLKGAKASDLSVERPMTFGLVLNMKTAQRRSTSSCRTRSVRAWIRRSSDSVELVPTAI
jgi:hypothetical protein